MSCTGVTSMGSNVAPTHDEFAVRPQTVDQLGHRFRARRCRQDYLRAAEFLQCFRRVSGFAVYVHVRPEFLGERRIFRPSSDSRDFIAKLVRELNSEVAQTADTLHRDKVSGERTAMTQRVVSGNSRAQQRRCFDVT